MYIVCRQPVHEGGHGDTVHRLGGRYSVLLSGSAQPLLIPCFAIHAMSLANRSPTPTSENEVGATEDGSAGQTNFFRRSSVKSRS